MSSSSSSSRNSPAALLLLAVGALAGVSVTLLTTWIVKQQHNNNKKINSTSDADEGEGSRNNRSSIQNGHTSNNNNNTNKTPTTLPLALRQEQLSRHTLYFGQAGMQRLQKARICVVGVGGVGSHAVHMLARSGVGCIRLVDFDQVSLSSLNRHACATLKDVGTPKVTCLANYCRELCPDVNHLELQAFCEMYTAQSGARLLDPCTRSPDEDETTNHGDNQQPPSQQWDLVIDAIDDVPTKACLIADCLERGIRVLSCMGAGGKCDFTRLHCSDLRTAAKDPLATKLRQCLKKRKVKLPTKTSTTSSATSSTSTDKKGDDDDSFYLDDMERLAVVYSSEKPVCKLADFTPQQKEQGVHQYGAVDGMRIRILPVLGTMPAIMGQGLAAVALTELAATIKHDEDTTSSSPAEDSPPPRMQPVPGDRISRNVRNKLLQRLNTRENKYAKRMLQEQNDSKVAKDTTTIISLDDVPPGGTVLKLGNSSDGTDTKNIWIGPLQIDLDDVEYLLEVWRNRCAITGARLGTVLELARWDSSKPSTCDNLILVASHALEKFQKGGGGGGGGGGGENTTCSWEWMIEPPVRQRIQERLASCRVDAKA